jgi:hypothetical protein
MSIPILAAFQKKPRNLSKEIHVRKWQIVDNKAVFVICQKDLCLYRISPGPFKPNKFKNKLHIKIVASRDTMVTYKIAFGGLIDFLF